MLNALLVALVLSQATEPAPAEPTPYPPAPAPAEPTPAATPATEVAQAEPAPTEEKKEKSPMAGFVEGEGFRLQDEEGNNVLRLALQAAYKFEPTWTNGVEQTRAAMAFMRPVLRGNLYRPWLKYWTSVELAGNPPYLLDAYFDVVPIDEFGARFGQQYSLFSRQEQLGPQQLFFPEWSPVADYFWPGRDKGGMVYGLLLDKKIEYYAGIFSGTPLRQLRTLPGNYEVQGRLVYNPLGPVNANEFPFTDKNEPLPFRLSFSLQGYQGKIQRAEENLNVNNGQLKTVATGDINRRWGAGADFWVQGGPFIVTAEVYGRRIEPLDGSGAYGQHGGFVEAIYDLWAQKIGLGAQFAWLEPDTTRASDFLTIAEAALVYFIHNPSAQLKLRYAHLRQQQPADPAETTPYTAGNTNVLTAQMNLSF